MDINSTRQYGDYRPIHDFLGAATFQVLAAPDRVESYIIEAGLNHQDLGLVGCTILAKGPLLKDEQVTRLRQSILTPEAHYNGYPIFRRFPSVPDFAFRLWLADCVLDVLVDLHNPGWEFHCGAERYQNWNWVGDEMICLAKELFPCCAASSPRSVWQKGAIKSLKTKRHMPLDK